MTCISLINSETGEIDHHAIVERADLRAAHEYGGPNPPPMYIRDSVSWCTERARAERRQWRRDRGLGEELPSVPFHSFAPNTNE